MASTSRLFARLAFIHLCKGSNVTVPLPRAISVRITKRDEQTSVFCYRFFAHGRSQVRQVKTLRASSLPAHKCCRVRGNRRQTQHDVRLTLFRWFELTERMK